MDIMTILAIIIFCLIINYIQNTKINFQAYLVDKSCLQYFHEDMS